MYIEKLISIPEMRIDIHGQVLVKKDNLWYCLWRNGKWHNAFIEDDTHFLETSKEVTNLFEEF